MFYNINKKIVAVTIDGFDDIIFLSINPKDDMKLFCGFTQNST